MTKQQESLGQRIRFHLRKSEITMRELAEKIGVNEISVSRYINDQRMPKKDVLERIADVLNMSFDELTAGIEFDVDESVEYECSEVVISDDVVYETMLDAVLSYRSCWDEKQKLYLINLLSS